MTRIKLTDPRTGMQMVMSQAAFRKTLAYLKFYPKRVDVRKIHTRGEGRAALRRQLRTDARWQHANDVALPYRLRRVARIEALRRGEAA